MTILLALLCLTACSPETGKPDPMAPSAAWMPGDGGSPSALSLIDLAEMERRGGFVPGMGLKEAELALANGDGGSYVLALYKEILYASDAGKLSDRGAELAAIGKALAETGLLAPELARAQSALKSIAFLEAGAWEEAASAMPGMERDQPDGMRAWILALCGLYGDSDPQAQARYGAVQARYRGLPTYWYHAAARSDRIELRRDAAVRCVLLSPGGPKALKAREILALSYGLGEDDAASLVLSQEAQAIIGQALESGPMENLSLLFPVLSLPDNPETLFALGALKALAADPGILKWLKLRRAEASGRLAERLAYVTG